MAREIHVRPTEQVVPANTSRHGLVIGIETYENRKLSLKYVRRDAEAIYQVMVSPECGLFPEQNVQLLLDDAATQSGIRRAFSKLIRDANTDDTVWIFYAGHGGKEGDETYWVTHDADIHDLFGTALPRRDIAHFLNRISSKRVVTFLDCCHAEATVDAGARDALTAEEAFAAFQGEGRLTVCSCEGDQKSVELADHQHGAFTYYLVEGLKGAADKAGQGVVLADDLWQYLEGRVTDAARKARNPQTPRLISNVSHRLALTLNPVRLAEKAQLEEKIRGLYGPGPDKLTGGECDLAIRLVQEGAARPAEKPLADYVPVLASGSADVVRAFKSMVQVLEQSRGAEPAPGPAVGPRVEPVAAPPPPPPAPVSVQWHYVQAGQRQGPVDQAKLESLVASGELEEHDVVWRTGMAKWQPVSDVPELAELLPPPIPSPPEPEPEPRIVLPSGLALPQGSKDKWGNPVREGSDSASGLPWEVVLGGLGMPLVLCPAGEFMMGSSISPEEVVQRYGGEAENLTFEHPQHEVRITQPFYMGKYQVTQQECEAIVSKNPSNFKGKRNPVERVSWGDAVAFCGKVSEQIGAEVTLPTEAQWEYACRAGSEEAWCFGSDKAQLDRYAWYDQNSGSKTHPVGEKKPNPWGLYDVHGNVWEWCLDGSRSYSSSIATDPRGPQRAFRVLRGGCWRERARFARSAYRPFDIDPGNTYSCNGFRVLSAVPLGR